MFPRCGYWFRDSPAARASPREHAQVRGWRHALRIRRILDRGEFWGRLAGRGHCNHRLCGAVSRGRARGRRPYAPCRQGGVAMSVLISALRQFAGLFVEDGWLALAILGIVALAAIVALLMPRLSLTAGAILLFGCLGVLVANVMRAARRDQEP